MAVALRKESVDRNLSKSGVDNPRRQSLSARRAWIEIASIAAILDFFPTSLSARRAWIEIWLLGCCVRLPACRSPQGERG